MKEKFEVKTIFQTFHTMIQTQFQTTIKVFCFDNANDYFNTIVGDYLKNNGIIQQSSCLETPQQNGIAEKKNRHFLEISLSFMFSMINECS